MSGGDQPEREYPLERDDWAALLEFASGSDRAVIVERLGGLLANSVRRPLLRRAVDDAIRNRADQLRDARQQHERGRLVDEADSATERLARTLEHMRRQQDEDIEPEAAAIIALCGGDVAQGCFAVQVFLGAGKVRDAVLPALRAVSFDRAVLAELLAAGTPAEEALAVARALSKYTWWPLAMRRSVMAFLRSGGEPAAVLRCLNDLAFSGLSPRQQQSALSMLQAPDTPYGLDGTAVAAALLGIPLTSDGSRSHVRRTVVRT